MLELSTTTRGIEDWKMNARSGKKTNLTRMNARMREAIQLQIESSFQRKYQIFPARDSGYFFISSFFAANFLISQE